MMGDVLRRDILTKRAIKGNAEDQGISKEADQGYQKR